MWSKPTKQDLSQIPPLYSDEEAELKNRIIHAHFFLGGCDWYVIEFDGNDLFFGFAILNDDYQMAEWGYFSLSDLSSLKYAFMEVDFDAHWKKRPAKEVDRIVKARSDYVLP